MSNKIPNVNGRINCLSQLINARAVGDIVMCLLPWNCESHVKSDVKLVSAYWLMDSASRHVLQHLIQ